MVLVRTSSDTFKTDLAVLPLLQVLVDVAVLGQGYAFAHHLQNAASVATPPARAKVLPGSQRGLGSVAPAQALTGTLCFPDAGGRAPCPLQADRGSVGRDGV